MDLLTLPDVAEALGLPITRVHQMVRDGELVVVRSPENVRCIPAALIMDGEVVKSVPAVITLLRDGRFTDEEIAEWLHRADDTIPGTPIEALRANRGTEIKRRAQVAGY
jgi:hypothetical protein